MAKGVKSINIDAELIVLVDKYKEDSKLENESRAYEDLITFALNHKGYIKTVSKK